MRCFKIYLSVVYLHPSRTVQTRRKMAPQMNNGFPHNSGRKLRDDTDSSGRKLVNSSVYTAPIPRDLFTSPNPELPSGSMPNTPNNHKSPRGAPLPATPRNWYDASGSGLPAGWIVREDKKFYKSPKGTKHRSLKSAFKSACDGDKLVEGNLTYPEVDFINKVLTVLKDAQG